MGVAAPGTRSRFGNDPLTRFLVVGIGLYLGWLLLFHQVIHPWGWLDRTVINGLVALASLLLTALGYELLPEPRVDLERYIGVQGGTHLWIGDPCNGIPLFAVFTIFIIAFPGPWRHKAWFIPAGILLIHLLNAIRVAALCIVVTFGYEWLNFNHDYTFYVVVYGAVFLLWYVWVKRYSGWRKAGAA
ncbi:MAG: archaeosortase/exosortase family protein [Flavobacteriales bacterium]|jgi:exosortase family protein XrtF|nr:MAG: archaeosortase/exosortase family protein [Flavobacteriales bacterium]